METYLIPLRCIMLMIMVALMKNSMKKSTISAISLWRGEGMRYSRPVENNHTKVGFKRKSGSVGCTGVCWFAVRRPGSFQSQISAGFPCVCEGFLWVFQLPVQKQASPVN